MHAYSSAQRAAGLSSGRDLVQPAGLHVVDVAVDCHGRVDEWVRLHGDPRRRDRHHLVDWVELIPFAETRNYVQRVMENLQVYRTRFGNDASLTIEADLRRGAAAKK